MYTPEPSQKPNSGKRKLTINADQFQELHEAKRDTFRRDGLYDAPDVHSKALAPDTYARTNGVDGDNFSDLNDFPDSEFDNADFELNRLAAHNSPILAKQPGAQVFGDDVWQFISLPPSPDEKQPPSSVLREFDNISTSTNTTKFDPTLQFSPPKSTSPAIDEITSCDKGVSDDISWDYVKNQLQDRYNHRTPSCVNGRAAINSAEPSPRIQPATPPSTAVAAPAGMILRPYKTWFHIREMLEAKESMYKNQPGVKFELFARVVYTRRENFEKKQLFQLRDLFKINLPYISGVLLH
ncbi:hypothetical protein A9K55_002440 [Cordyceps militaris]|uniref:Uncharacterized protein n=1 Tax=Cordyceps militaris TaxID=73501 RepID=A0A2H4S8U8_CORMI|nr:hypothetical protein A9K55_002440 [Cordyceps militaris]